LACKDVQNLREELEPFRVDEEMRLWTYKVDLHQKRTWQTSLETKLI